MTPLKLGRFNKSPEHKQALDRVKGWSYRHFNIPEEAPILVCELACALPNCAPLETMIAFWTEDGERHHFKIFKSVLDVVPEDLPATWLDDALFVSGGIDCSCC